MMNNHDLVKNAFSNVDMEREITVESLSKGGNKKLKLWASAAAVLTVCLIGSNTIAYAATGETWLQNMWTHVSGTSTIEGEEYQTDTMTYEGNGYTIDIESAYLADGNSVMDASILTSDGSEGIDVVEEGDSVYLVFGENRIDVTEQLQQYGWAVGKIALGEEIIVYELFDLRNREDIQGIARGFYQYNEFVNSVLDEQERTVLDASPIYYAE